MKNFLTIAGALALFFGCVSPSLAQAFGGRFPGGTPFIAPTSPYLNLNRAGSNPAINYYGLVRPEFEFRAAYQSLQREVGQDRALVRETIGEGGLPVTGHSTSFLNFSHFFPGPGVRAVTRTPTGASTIRTQQTQTQTLSPPSRGTSSVRP
jgi:hypothetical protein